MKIKLFAKKNARPYWASLKNEHEDLISIENDNYVELYIVGRDSLFINDKIRSFVETSQSYEKKMREATRLYDFNSARYFFLRAEKRLSDCRRFGLC